MSLLRRQQRLITIAITVCCISTFVFFGSSRAFAPSHSASNEVVWQVGELKLSQQEISARAHFLACEMAGAMQSPSTWCAWMNPGFISQWILNSGLGAQMIQSSPLMLKEMAQAKAKEARWQGYKHPYLGHLNYEAILSQFNPPLAQALKKWKSDSECLAEVKIELYKQAARMPSEFFATVIRYHEASVPNQQKDASLGERSMAVFGYESMEQWFGKAFMNSCVKLIAMGAQEALSLGYDISETEIRQTVHARLEEIWSKLGEKGLDMSLPAFKAQMFRSFGMNEEGFIKFWKELVLFENFYHHQGSQTFADPLAAQAMSAFTQETREIELYEIPAAFRVNSLEALAKLQLYWHFVTGLSLSDPVVPLHMRQVNEISTACPELMARRITLEWKTLKMEDLRARLGPKKMIVLQSQDDIWPVMVSHGLPQQAKSVKERMEGLYALDKTTREKIDKETLKWLLKHKPEEVASFFEETQPHKETLLFAHASARQPIEGITNINQLLKELEKGPMTCPYTQDENHYYLFNLVDKGQEVLLDFSQSQELSILEALLSKKLKVHYETMKSRQAPALYKEGKLLEFSKVRAQVMMDLFQPVLIELQHQMAQWASQAPKSQIYKLVEANEAASYRFVALLQQTSLLESQENETLAWLPVKTVQNLRRTDAYSGPLAQIFERSAGEWTSVESVKPLLFQKAKLVKVLPRSKDQGDIWSIVDSSQLMLDAVVSQEYLQSWAKLHQGQWLPETHEPVQKD